MLCRFCDSNERNQGFSPNWKTHPAFGEALLQAKKAGVVPLAFECEVLPQRVQLAGR